jgi:hypothetical protein
MNTAASGLSSGNKIATYQENRASRKTDLTFFTKGMLKRHIESQDFEIEKLNLEVLRLLSQRNEDLKVMNEQKDTIIHLYSHVNKDSDISPLMKAV